MTSVKPKIGTTERAHSAGPIGDELLSVTPYVETPAVDALYSIAVQLAASLWVTRERMLATEALLIERGIVTLADIESYRAPPEVEADREAGRDKFIADIFRAVKAV